MDMITKELLTDLYIEKCMTMREIAEDYFGEHISHTTVRKYLIEFGILSQLDSRKKHSLRMRRKFIDAVACGRLKI